MRLFCLLFSTEGVFFSSNKRYSRPAPTRRTNSESRSNNLFLRCFYNLNINYLSRWRDDKNADRYQSISINWKSTYWNRRRLPRHTRAARARRAVTTKFQEKNTGEIRRSWTARWDTAFFTRAATYVVLRRRGEMHRSWTARWHTAFFTRAGDTSFFVRAARSVVLQPPGEIRRSSSGRRDTTFCRSAVDIVNDITVNIKMFIFVRK